jgi:hypothetical protein
MLDSPGLADAGETNPKSETENPVVSESSCNAYPDDGATTTYCDGS